MPVYKIENVIQSREEKLLQEFVEYNFQKEFKELEKWQFMIYRGYAGHIRIKVYFNNNDKEAASIPILKADNVSDILNSKAVHKNPSYNENTKAVEETKNKKETEESEKSSDKVDEHTKEKHKDKVKVIENNI